MTNHDDELAELTAALDVTPPASFASGVRARVAQSRARTRQMWWGLAAAASVTLAMVMMWRPAPPVTEVATTAMVAPVIPAADIQRAAEPATAERVASAAPASRAAARLVSVRPETTPAEPALVVMTNQPALLRALWADFDGKNVSLVQVEAVSTSADGMTKPIAVEPIVVAPIVVAPIVVNGIGTSPGRGGATPAIRRVDAARETK
ncbi:MAG TPA: hypothetical protein PKW63_03825 [Vicinamibacterales bacterium]|nr:hypothetical protein [Vicinamibacterales bacterium]